MTKSCVLVLFILMGMSGNAQKNHFIAIQSENKQPFYAKVEASSLKSTPTGHLIIPKLIDSTYVITIGFASHNLAEEQFSIPVTKDIGFILKVGKDNRLFLANSQTTHAVLPLKQQQFFVSADTSGTMSGLPVTKKSTDGSFSKLMAQVVNDSAVMEKMDVADDSQKELAKKEVAKTEQPSAPPVLVDTLSTLHKSKKKSDDAIQKKIAVIKTPENKVKSVPEKIEKPIVNKLSQTQKDSAMEMVYEDVSRSGKKDTIDVLIPFEVPPAKAGSVANNDPNKNNIPEVKQEIRIDSPTISKSKPDQKTVPAKSVTSTLKKDSVLADTSKTALYRPITTNTNCKNTATDYDVDKLRVKMLAIEDEDDKISTAKKVFKAKCFSVNQIKALSEIFPNDAGKYRLFDAAYAYVFDINNFTSLQSLLKEDYYITRFKAMIK